MNAITPRHRIDLELPENPTFEDLVEVGERVVQVREATKFSLGQLARIVTDLYGTKYGDQTLSKWAHLIGMEYPDQVYAYRDVWDFWGAPRALPHIFWSHYRLLQLRFPNKLADAESWLAYASTEKLTVRALSQQIIALLPAGEVEEDEPVSTPQLDSAYRYQISGLKWSGDAELRGCTVREDGIHVELIVPLESAADLETISAATAVSISIEVV